MGKQLTEADVLFELFLPMLCESRADALTHFKSQVQFYLRSTPPRAWVLKGGARPWLTRGELPEGQAGLVVTVSEELVKQLVQGREPDLVLALQQGALGIKGELKVLEALDLTLGEARSVLQTLLHR